MSRSLIDVANDLAEKEYKDQIFNFSDLYNKLIKNLRLDEQTKNNNIGEFYADLMQDKRFVFCGKNQWRLSKFLNLSDIAALHSNLYNDGSDTIYEEGFEVKPIVDEQPNINGSSFSVEQSDQISEESVQEFMDAEIEEEEELNADFTELERNYSHMDSDDEDVDDDESNRE